MTQGSNLSLLLGRRVLYMALRQTQRSPEGPRHLHSGDLRELPRVPLRGEGSCGGGGCFSRTASDANREQSPASPLDLMPRREPEKLARSHPAQGCQVPFCTSGWNVGLLLIRCSGQGPHLAMTGEPRGFSRVAAGFSNYDGEFRLPLVLSQGDEMIAQGYVVN